MNKKSNHAFQVIISERALRKNKREIKKILEDLLKNNEILLTNTIFSFLEGQCNKCGISVTQLKYHRRYKSICYTCHKKYKP